MRFMRISFALAALCFLAACTDAGSGDTANDLVAANMLAPDNADPVAAIPADAPDSHAKPAPGELGVFKNWTVGCDNLKTCKAVALSPEDGEFASTLMSITRDGGTDGAFVVHINGQKVPAIPIIVAVDGKPVARGGTASDEGVAFTGADARTIAREAANGNQISLTGAKGDQATVSLAGLSAALRYMDAEQGLAGSTTAIVARGDATARITAPKLPVIRAAALANDKSTKLSDEAIDTLRKTNNCEIANFMTDPPTPDYAPLGSGKTLMLLPCDSGAYNLMAIPFVIGANGTPEVAKFDAETGMSEPGATVQLVNAAFDGRVLGTFAKARGLGDCGISQQFVWDGTQFRLSEQSEMGECRGSTDYITTWRAAVLR